jgi:processive 1,2-diacylglycerol beta-glucosyltransferase
MYCPNCGEQYKWFETTCPKCDVDLVESRPGAPPDPDATLESVFETQDSAALPLATVTLEQQGIEYAVRGGGTLDALRLPPDGLDLAKSDATHQIVVRKEDAARARELLADLETAQAGGPAAIAAAPPAAESGDASPPSVVDLHTGQSLGELTPEQAQFLVDALEEESPDEARYYIDAATIDMLEGAGAEPSLIALLKRALGPKQGIEIRF